MSRFTNIPRRRSLKYDPESPYVNWNDLLAQALLTALQIAAERPDILRSFLDDLMTRKEIEQIIARFQTIRLIKMGAPYRYINEYTGLSPATISRLTKTLCNKQSGLREILQKMHPAGLHHLLK